MEIETSKQSGAEILIYSLETNRAGKITAVNIIFFQLLRNKIEKIIELKHS